MGMVPSQAGKVVWLGENLRGLSLKQLRKRRQRLQMVFQDPLASLSPRMTVGDIIAEPLRTHYPDIKGAELREKVDTIMDRVGLHPHQKNRYPHEFSGGQCQRVGIARALILEPKLIICDEPVSALDVSVQAQVINLLGELQETMGLTLLFIAHDLSMVRYISDVMVVMYLGSVVEQGPADQVFFNPQHPYTQALTKSNPLADPKLERHRQHDMIKGEVPSPVNLPPGCRFAGRCDRVTDRCRQGLLFPLTSTFTNPAPDSDSTLIVSN